MLNINSKKEIRLTRGDTAKLSVAIADINDENYEMTADDILVFSVKKSVNDDNYIFQKILYGESDIVIEPIDTSKIDFGKYYYDVQLTIAGKEIYTIIEPTPFYIREEVTI